MCSNRVFFHANMHWLRSALGMEGRGGGWGDVDLRLFDPVSKVVLVAPGRFYKEGSQIQTHPETRRGVHRQLKV